MKYGVHLPNFGAFGDPHTLLELAQGAEAAGWDGFFIWDHVNREEVMPHLDPWVAMAALALHTHTLRLGALVTPLPRRRPWVLARQAVSVDALSGGRLVFGFGIGSGRVVEWDDFGEEVDPKVRGRMLDEGLEIFTGLCSGEEFAFEGEFYTVAQTRFLPKPAQNPRIPLWGAGYWPAKTPFRRAARYDGIIPLFRDEQDLPGQLKQVVDYARAHREADGPFDVVYLDMTDPLSDWERIGERVPAIAAAGATWWVEEITPQRFGAGWEDEWPLDQIRARIQHGPPRA